MQVRLPSCHLSRPAAPVTSHRLETLRPPASYPSLRGKGSRTSYFLPPPAPGSGALHGTLWHRGARRPAGGRPPLVTPLQGPIGGGARRPGTTWVANPGPGFSSPRAPWWPAPPKGSHFFFPKRFCRLCGWQGAGHAGNASRLQTPVWPVNARPNPQSRSAAHPRPHYPRT